MEPISGQSRNQQIINQEKMSYAKAAALPADFFEKSKRMEGWVYLGKRPQHFKAVPIAIPATVLVSPQNDKLKSNNCSNFSKGFKRNSELVDYHERLIESRTEGNSEKARLIIEEMRSQQMKPDSLCYLYYIQTLAKEGLPEVIEAVMLEAKNDKIALIPHYYTSLMKAYTRCCDVKGALKVFEHQRKLGHPLDHISLNGLLNVYAKQGDVSNARIIFEEMKVRGFYPDQVAVSTMMDAYKIAMDWEGAWRFYHEMLRENVEIEMTTLTSLMYVSAKSKQDGLAWIAFEGLKIAAKKLGKEDVVYQLAVQAFYQGGNMENVWKVYELSKQGSGNPTAVFYDFVLHCAAIIGNRRDVERALEIYRKSKYELNFHSFNTLLKICKQNRDVKMANEIWSKMSERGIRPRLINYQSFFQVCLKANRAEGALEVYDQFTRSGLPGDRGIYRAMINLGKQCRNTHLQAIGLQGLKDLGNTLSQSQERLVQSNLR